MAKALISIFRTANGIIETKHQRKGSDEEEKNKKKKMAAINYFFQLHTSCTLFIQIFRLKDIFARAFVYIRNDIENKADEIKNTK